MTYKLELKEYHPTLGFDYIGILTFDTKETILRIDNQVYVLPGNMEILGRNSIRGQVDSHDSLSALVVLEDDLGACRFTFKRK